MSVWYIYIIIIHTNDTTAQFLTGTRVHLLHPFAQVESNGQQKIVSLLTVNVDKPVNVRSKLMISTEASTFVKLTQKICSRETGCLAKWHSTKL